MHDEDLNKIVDFHEAVKTMDSRGFQILLAELGQERERLIKIVAGARVRGKDKVHGWEYFQGSLAEFQNVIDIFDRIRERYAELSDLARKEREDGPKEKESARY